MLEKLKVALSIDSEDNYFDTYLETLLMASEDYIKEIVIVKKSDNPYLEEEIDESLQARYEITIIALATYMFNNREMQLDSNKTTNKIIKSLLNSIRYCDNV